MFEHSTRFRPILFNHIFVNLSGMTNFDLGGVERITVSTHRPQFNAQPHHGISLGDLSSDEHSVQEGLLAPHGLYILKGWTRMVCCYTILAVAYSTPEIMKAP